MQKIKISQLSPHPQNPRLVMREDVIEAICAGLKDGFKDCYAIQAFPNGDGYTILSGHHRVEAARREGIEEVPAFVRNDIDEEGAYMVLATANSQGELSPLEIGMHALHYVEKSSGGRGKKGGLSAYAELIGKHEQNIRIYRQAAEVIENLNNDIGVSDLLEKAAHLSAIHKLPESLWQPAVESLLNSKWSAKDVAEKAKAASEVEFDKWKLAVFRGETNKRELDRILEIHAKVSSDLDQELSAEWDKWFFAEQPDDVKKIQAKRIEFEDEQAKRNEQPPPERCNLILADPPWRYDFAESDNRQIENQYPSATVEEICAMSPATEDNAVLFLWATVAKLPEAFKVMDAWGFKYKTSAIWDKEKIGMGYWFRGQHELLLVGTKGEFSPPEQSQRVSSVFREARGKHSAKPECVYSWIESAFPGTKKLEMFCRSPRTGWEVFGNESK